MDLRKDWREKLLLTGGILLLILLMYVTGIGCPILHLTGIPCLGCGMTRAVLAALRLDFRAAFGYHGMFWSLPVVYLYLICDLAPFRSRRLNVIVGAALVIGFCLNWILKR